MFFGLILVGLYEEGHRMSALRFFGSRVLCAVAVVLCMTAGSAWNSPQVEDSGGIKAAVSSLPLLNCGIVSSSYLLGFDFFSALSIDY